MNLSRTPDLSRGSFLRLPRAAARTRYNGTAMSLPESDPTIDLLIQHLEQHAGHEHPCPYLQGRTAKLCGFLAEEMSPELYHRLMDRGFRRRGHATGRQLHDHLAASGGRLVEDRVRHLEQ